MATATGHGYEIAEHDEAGNMTATYVSQGQGRVDVIVRFFWLFLVPTTLYTSIIHACMHCMDEYTLEYQWFSVLSQIQRRYLQALAATAQPPAVYPTAAQCVFASGLSP